MIRVLVCAAVLLAAAPALAQQSPAEQAVLGKLLREIQDGLNCSTEKIALQDALEKAQARIKELEQPKAAEPAKPNP